MTATIFALATGVGRSAVAVIRLSGPAAAEAVVALAGPLPPPRVATLRTLRDPRAGAVLDQGLVLWFPAPASVTGEDCAEFQIHGGRAVVAAILAALGACDGCRLAEPGEFTRRALLNGKMDLPAVEGLADLIDAETEAQRRQALRQQDGALAHWVAAQRATLIEALAAAESAIDFSDEADVAGDFAAELQRCVAALQAAIDAEIGRLAQAAQIRDGFVVALAGPPNAGKSTLLNALARRDVAIVSPYPGTTRDPVEVRLDLGGFLVQVVDTAGLRPTDDPIEMQGVERALDRARAADLVLWLADASAPCPPDPALAARRLWRVATKIDMSGADPGGADFAIAAPDGIGLQPLIEAITRLIGADLADDAGVSTRERHRAALHAAAATLAELAERGSGADLEVATEQLRDVAAHLDSLLGRIDNEAVLGAIFARFCVGK